MSRNKKWSSAVKFEIALLSLKEEVTISEICKRYQVSPSQVHSWKKELHEHGSQLFSRGDKSSNSGVLKLERDQSKLYEKIGKLVIERDFLKKSYAKLTGSGDED